MQPGFYTPTLTPTEGGEQEKSIDFERHSAQNQCKKKFFSPPSAAIAQHPVRKQQEGGGGMVFRAAIAYRNLYAIVLNHPPNWPGWAGPNV
jgi:hypothetical protein